MSKKADGDEMRPSYDFSHGVRGRHAARYRPDAPVTILLDEPTRLAPSPVGVPWKAPRFPLLDRADEQGPHYQEA